MKEQGAAHKMTHRMGVGLHKLLTK